MNWRLGRRSKRRLSEEARGELEKQTELLSQVLADKEKEISDAKDRLRQVKDEAIREYHDSNTLLAELGRSFAEGFDDCLHQVKVSYPDLDLSHVTIDVQAQPSIQPVQFESTSELFTDDAPVDDPHGDKDTAPIVDSAGHHETHVVEEENAPVQH